MPTQAEWLLSLTEDLERHSSACQYGCAPEADRVCVGGSIMAWVDEWWKGRDRGDLVRHAHRHDGRPVSGFEERPLAVRLPTLANGEDTGSQPDSYVNEEWSASSTCLSPRARWGSWGSKSTS